MLTSICLFKPSRSSNWYVQYKDADGIRRQKSTRCSNKHDALKALTEIKTLIKSKPRVILFSKLAEQFLTYARSNYPYKTYAIYKAALQRFQSICGDVELNKLSAQHWDTYRVKRLKQTISPKFTNRISPVSVNIELRTLRAFLNTLIRWGHLERNPFSKQPFASVSEQAPVFFTKADFQKLLGLIKQPWLKEAVIFSVVTGLRRGELINLRWQDVNLQRRVMTILIG